MVRVLEDDSVKLERNGVVKLAGIHTPTRGVPECYARVPFARTRSLLPRRTKVTVVEVEDGGADLQLSDGSSVNARLVREGYARRRRRKVEDGLSSALARAESAAKREQLGIWQTCDATTTLPFATFDDVDSKPTPAKDFGALPDVVRSCGDFDTYEDALAIFERTTSDQVRRKLDRDGDGVPCPGLPHTTSQERYRFKKLPGA